MDDYRINEELRNDRSFPFELAVEPDGTILELRLRPVEIEACAVHRATGDVARWCRETLIDRSRDYGTTFERAGEGLRVVP